MVEGDLKAAALEGKSCVVSISLCISIITRMMMINFSLCIIIMTRMMMMMLLIERINISLCISIIITRMMMLMLMIERINFSLCFIMTRIVLLYSVSLLSGR